MDVTDAMDELDPCLAVFQNLAIAVNRLSCSSCQTNAPPSVPKSVNRTPSMVQTPKSAGPSVSSVSKIEPRHSTLTGQR